MDFEFEKIKQLLPEVIVNNAAEKEHMAEVERKIGWLRNNA